MPLQVLNTLTKLENVKGPLHIDDMGQFKLHSKVINCRQMPDISNLFPQDLQLSGLNPEVW